MKEHFSFFEKYHRGTINLLLHFFGFALWGYGTGTKNWFLIFVSPLIFESGHLYNYMIGIKTEKDKQMIPAQIMTWILFILLAYFLTRLN